MIITKRNDLKESTKILIRKNESKSNSNKYIILKYEIVQVIKNAFTKYNIFIILSIIILVFSLYYVFCFKNIYSSLKGELPII